MAQKHRTTVHDTLPRNEGLGESRAWRSSQEKPEIPSPSRPPAKTKPPSHMGSFLELD